MMKDLSIDQLLSRCSANDQHAQLEVYRRYHLAMYHSALRIVQHAVDAEDVMQEGFLTAFEKLDQYKGENKFGGWLKQIVIRKALHLLEKRERNKHYDLNEALLSDPTENTEKSYDLQLLQLHQALNQLKTRYRNVLILMYFEGYDYEEISSILHLSYGNCRTLISRAKDQLKQKLLSNEIPGKAI
ncbi:MAG: RNA polymerase sigma factor [Flavobacteriaceae bacterium]